MVENKNVIRILIAVILLFGIYLLAGTVNGNAFGKEVHVVILSEEKAEVVVVIDLKSQKTEEVNSGINYLPYKSKEEEPNVEVIAYGDTIHLKPKEGKNGEWYAFVKIASPKDGDGKYMENRVL